MAENNIEQTSSQPEVTPEEKFRVVSGILPIIAGSPDLIISGSLAQQVSTLEQDSWCILKAEDLANINDVDIATTTFITEGYEEAVQEIVGQSGFGVEMNPIYLHCAYDSSPVRNLATREVNLEIKGNGQQTYQVRYSTPAFLLLSLVDSSVSNKTPASKYRQKVLALQKLSRFSQSDFITLAQNELQIRKEMNKQTFDLWRKSVLAELEVLGVNLSLLLQRKFKEISSLIDKAQLFNLIKTANDLMNVDFHEIRRISSLERFLREFEVSL
jgi:hypothetical protein